MGFIPSQIALMNACSERVNTNRANKQATNAQKHRRREVACLLPSVRMRSEGYSSCPESVCLYMLHVCLSARYSGSTPD